MRRRSRCTTTTTTTIVNATKPTMTTSTNKDRRRQRRNSTTESLLAADPEKWTIENHDDPTKINDRMITRVKATRVLRSRRKTKSMQSPLAATTANPTSGAANPPSTSSSANPFARSSAATFAPTDERPKRKKRRLTSSPSNCPPSKIASSTSSTAMNVRPQFERSQTAVFCDDQPQPQQQQQQPNSETLQLELAAARKEYLESRSMIECLRGSLGQARNAMLTKVENDAIADRATIRDRTVRNSMRLGQYLPQKHSLSYCEIWQNGLDFKHNEKWLKEIAKKKEALEKEKKMKKKPDFNRLHHLAASASRNDSAESWSSEYSDNPQLVLRDYNEHDDLMRIRTAALKKEEAECFAEHERLEREKCVHIRELKRINQEDSSTFYQQPPEQKVNCTITANGFTLIRDRYLLVKLLGKGGFSEVHKAYDLKDFTYVACKVHMLNKEWSREKKINYMKHGIRENDILRAVKHPRIVDFLDSFDMDPDWFCTVLEFFDGKDLDLVLKEQKYLAEKEAKCILNQIVSALLYLNTCVKPPVIHYDLKPANVLVGVGVDYGKVKLTDFGLSKQMHQDVYDPERGMDLTSQGAGTYWYLPPEVFVQSLKPPKISSKVDVWSLGCLYFQCLFGRKPFGHNLSQSALLECETILRAKHVQFPNKPSSTIEARSFISVCLTYEVKNRPDIIQLADNDYLHGTTRRSAVSHAASTAATPLNNSQTNQQQQPPPLPERSVNETST